MMKTNFFIVCSIVLATSCGADEEIESQVMNICISDSTRQASCVYLTADEKNQPVISWCETDTATRNKNFYMAFFNERNGSFSDRINIPLEQNANLHEEGMPKLAVKADGTIIAVYEVSVNSAKNRFAGLVRYVVSANKGRSWTQPASLHADTSQDNSHSFAAITKLSDGEIGACWLDQSFDQKIGGRPVKFAKTNLTNSFENELVIDSVACQCCRIAMSSGADGKIAVAFRDIINDSIRDMSVSSSNDNGKTFSTAVPFSKDNWVINGCPHNGPSLAFAGETTSAAWFTGGNKKGIYYCEMNAKNEVISKQLVSNNGRFIQLCLLPDGTRMLAYNETVKAGTDVYNKIVVSRITSNKVFSSNISARESNASYPVLRPVGNDKVIIAWWDNNRVYYAVASSESINTPVKPPSGGDDHFERYNLSRTKLAVSKDLVCGMPLSMSPGDTASFKGRIYGFCSDICKLKFSENPESFVAH